MGDTFQVAVFTTDELYNDCEDYFGYGYEARNIAMDIIEGAFDRSSRHSVEVNRGSKVISAPQEHMSGPFQAYRPCGSYMVEWNDLRDWWEFWVEEASCHDPHAQGRDCALLLTAADGGGRGANEAACVGGAFKVAKQFSSYEEYGYTEAHKKAKNILHEVGHNLTHNMENQDDLQLAHDSAQLHYHFEGNTITPMGISGDATENNGADETYWHTNKRDNYDGQGWELKYSDVTEDNIEARPR